jgi:hypothetical protein
MIHHKPQPHLIRSHSLTSINVIYGIVPIPSSLSLCVLFFLFLHRPLCPSLSPPLLLVLVATHLSALSLSLGFVTRDPFPSLISLSLTRETHPLSLTLD